ncbi:MAG: HPr family phosphocarrier protein [Lachnospiraceae bacterium]|nr:HPr family phosphocarrier protein [Lachnospiraceae bacterium]
MKEFRYTITDKIGIHARPAGELAKLTKEFQSRVKIRAGEKEAAAGRLMAVMALGIRNGQEIVVTAEGPDEERAAERLEEFFRNNL